MNTKFFKFMAVLAMTAMPILGHAQSQERDEVDNGDQRPPGMIPINPNGGGYSANPYRAQSSRDAAPPAAQDPSKNNKAPDNYNYAGSVFQYIQAHQGKTEGYGVGAAIGNVDSWGRAYRLSLTGYVHSWGPADGNKEKAIIEGQMVRQPIGFLSGDCAHSGYSTGSTKVETCYDSELSLNAKYHMGGTKTGNLETRMHLTPTLLFTGKDFKGGVSLSPSVTALYNGTLAEDAKARGFVGGGIGGKAFYSKSSDSFNFIGILAADYSKAFGDYSLDDLVHVNFDLAAKLPKISNWALAASTKVTYAGTVHKDETQADGQAAKTVAPVELSRFAPNNNMDLTVGGYLNYTW